MGFEYRYDLHRWSALLKQFETPPEFFRELEITMASVADQLRRDLGDEAILSGLLAHVANKTIDRPRAVRRVRPFISQDFYSEEISAFLRTPQMTLADLEERAAAWELHSYLRRCVDKMTTLLNRAEAMSTREMHETVKWSARVLTDFERARKRAHPTPKRRASSRTKR